MAYYAGARLYDYSTIMFPNMTIDEKEERHKNLVSKVKCIWVLLIPSARGILVLASGTYRYIPQFFCTNKVHLKHVESY